METRLGLRQNWQQFSLLVMVNALVGGMIGLERTILPELAGKVFGLEARATMLSFIVVLVGTCFLRGHFPNPARLTAFNPKQMQCNWRMPIT